MFKCIKLSILLLLYILLFSCSTPRQTKKFSDNSFKKSFAIEDVVVFTDEPVPVKIKLKQEFSSQSEIKRNNEIHKNPSVEIPTANKKQKKSLSTNTQKVFYVLNVSKTGTTDYYFEELSNIAAITNSVGLNDSKIKVEPPSKKSHPLAVKSFFIALYGLIPILGMLISVLAIVSGTISLLKIKEKPNIYGGKGFAIAAIVIGSLIIFIYFMLFLLFVISTMA